MYNMLGIYMGAMVGTVVGVLSIRYGTPARWVAAIMVLAFGLFEFDLFANWDATKLGLGIGLGIFVTVRVVHRCLHRTTAVPASKTTKVRPLPRHLAKAVIK